MSKGGRNKLLDYLAGFRLHRSMKTEQGRLELERLIYNARIKRLRALEYPMLKGITYLDHGGTTLASKSLLKSFSREMQRNLLANPHSDASRPSASAIIVEETRRKVLDLFNADPLHFDVVFTANATAAIKLVMEPFMDHDGGFMYYYHRNCHTSLVGIRETAQQSYCLSTDEITEQWLHEGHHAMSWRSDSLSLFAYPAQSNLNGQRLPLDWGGKVRTSSKHINTYTLLDVAALVSTCPLDLQDHRNAPDFAVLSFYKVFGFPDLGALIVRKSSASVFNYRRYFGGGTTEMVTCIEESWVARKEATIHQSLEDGTIAIRSILALKCAIDNHVRLFGEMEEVSKHTTWLAQELHRRLQTLRHASGVPVCRIYQATSSLYGDPHTQGPTIAFNILESDGRWRSPWIVGSMLREKGVYVRSGSVCNPAGMACALEISSQAIRKAFSHGIRCNKAEDVIDGKPFGVVRVTLGAITTLEDVIKLYTCIKDSFCNTCSNAIQTGVELA